MNSKKLTRFTITCIQCSKIGKPYSPITRKQNNIKTMVNLHSLTKLRTLKRQKKNKKGRE